jgi:hypothetical protein
MKPGRGRIDVYGAGAAISAASSPNGPPIDWKAVERLPAGARRSSTDTNDYLWPLANSQCGGTCGRGADGACMYNEMFGGSVECGSVAHCSRNA